MLIGEAPGAREDAEGRPFVGQAGRFLDQMLRRAGLTRARTFITNSVKCRPPRNRAPLEDELSICKESWLDRQIGLVDPRIVVLLGTTPIRQAFGRALPLSEVHGRIWTADGRRYLCTYHPAAARRFPVVRAAMEADFRILRRLVHRR
jgi:DNA polymerase